MPLGKNLQFLRDSVPKYRRVFLQGGSRSSKTYSTLQYLISLATKYNGLGVISICRESYNALKATAMRDFFDILIDAGIYRDQDYNRTDHIYRLNGNTFEFFGLDSPGKVQGRKRDILFVNEIMETDYRVYKQLVLRTTGRIIGDFNPTEIEHWVYDEISRPDAAHVISTYLDNPHLNADTIAEIEYLKQADHDLWRIYGEGMPATVRNVVYSHWRKAEYSEPSERCYGLDFGYNHPTALVEVGHVGDAVQWHQVIYQSHLTTPDLIRMMNELGINKHVMIYADGSRPEAIREINSAGYRIKAVEKYPGSVKEQIVKVKSKPLILSSTSTDLMTEIRSYKWSENNTEEPVKFRDDGMDAGRYGTHGLIKGRIKGPVMTLTTGRR
jgi:phage terminase large subunit